MRPSEIRSAISRVRGPFGVKDVDELMYTLRDGGALTPEEREVMLLRADRFRDDAKQRVLMHLSAMSKSNAWLNLEVQGPVTQVGSRTLDVQLEIAGLSARVGTFESALSLTGKAEADGLLKLSLDGCAFNVPVTSGDSAAVILERAQSALPLGVAGVVHEGALGPLRPSYEGGLPAPELASARLLLYRPEALKLLPGESPLRVVVTGYGKFQGIVENPSALLAQILAENGVAGGIVEYRRLDVVPAAVDAFIEEMKSNPPDVILSMGVTGGQSQLEERPENRLGGGTDGDENPIAERPIIAGAPETLPTDLPIDSIEWSLRRFGDARATFTSRSDENYSPDRSQYLCNYLGYRLAAAFGEDPKVTAGFFHVNRETTVDQMHAVLDAIVAKQLEVRRNSVAVPNS